MPSAIEPQLATLVARPPARGEWSWEIKYKYVPRRVLRFEGLLSKSYLTALLRFEIATVAFGRALIQRG
jgi:hypothetical protein